MNPEERARVEEIEKQFPAGEYRSHIDNDCYYDTLSGPGDFQCSLGEPEDRTWCRDASPVVDELEKYNSSVQFLLALVRQQAAQLGKQDERWEKLKKTISKSSPWPTGGQLKNWILHEMRQMEELEREQS